MAHGGATQSSGHILSHDCLRHSTTLWGGGGGGGLRSHLKHLPGRESSNAEL